MCLALDKICKGLCHFLHLKSQFGKIGKSRFIIWNIHILFRDLQGQMSISQFKTKPSHLLHLVDMDMDQPGFYDLYYIKG